MLKQLWHFEYDASQSPRKEKLRQFNIEKTWLYNATPFRGWRTVQLSSFMKNQDRSTLIDFLLDTWVTDPCPTTPLITIYRHQWLLWPQGQSPHHKVIPGVKFTPVSDAALRDLAPGSLILLVRSIHACTTIRLGLHFLLDCCHKV